MSVYTDTGVDFYENAMLKRIMAAGGSSLNLPENEESIENEGTVHFLYFFFSRKSSSDTMKPHHTN